MAISAAPRPIASARTIEKRLCKPNSMTIKMNIYTKTLYVLSFVCMHVCGSTLRVLLKKICRFFGSRHREIMKNYSPSAGDKCAGKKMLRFLRFFFFRFIYLQRGASIYGGEICNYNDGRRRFASLPE